MQNNLKILACLDNEANQSPLANDNKDESYINSNAIVDYAAWAALQINAPLEFLHVLSRHTEIGSSVDHSGAMGFNERDHLLERLSSEDENRAKVAREQGRLFMKYLRKRAISGGVGQVDSRLRHGSFEANLIELEKSSSLVVLGKNGYRVQNKHLTQQNNSSTIEKLGENVERMIGILQNPIFSITPSQPFQKPARALIAFDNSKTMRRVVSNMSNKANTDKSDMSSVSLVMRDLSIHLLMRFGKDSERNRAEKALTWAKFTLQNSGFSVSSEFVENNADNKSENIESIINQAVDREKIDVLVMGAYSHSPIRRLFMGSKTNKLLRSVKIPTLLVR